MLQAGPGYFYASNGLLEDKEAFPECAWDRRYSGHICAPSLNHT